MKKILSLILGVNVAFTTGCALFEPTEEFDPNVLPPSAAGGVTDVTSQVSTSDDDAEQRPDGRVVLGSSDLELTTDRDMKQIVGLRFKLNVPQGKQIQDATIQFTADETDTVSTSLKIYAEASDNAPIFKGGDNNISNRKKTSNSVNWTPPAWNNRSESGSGQRTPSLASITQEVIDRPGWKSGNYIVYIITGSGTRTAESYNGSTSGAPKLMVTYSDKVVEPDPTPPPEESPLEFGYTGKAYDPLVKPVYDLGYRDGFASVDSDKDGLPDSWEIAYGLDPSNASDSASDPDQDLLTAREEFYAATNPKDPDSDGDGMPDGYEVIYSLNPLDSADSLTDMDGDGYTNLDEYLKQTDPSNPLEYPVITPVTYSVNVVWEAPSARTDGTTLSEDEIASFTIYYGTSQGSLSNSVIVDDPTLRSYKLEMNNYGDYFFTVTATDTNGTESDPSEVASITIAP
ncbi:hypothetical protein [Alkalimarinus coralli]|uniref:hypothetical protein n=1 Tax=Alkalimarinus coralli TaxID=2935863 RepID=UPI00202B7382|nr:hypothetical protein [Alkalimarinus coralli]